MLHLFRTLFLGALLMSATTAICFADAYQEGDSGQDVSVVQNQLNALGYNIGNVDGTYGPMTTEAVKAFQRDRGLEVDGVIGNETFRILMGREMPPVSRDSSNVSVRRLIQTALRFQGVPYSFGGTGPGGFDCSGFVRYVFANNGVYLPRMADEQFEVGHAVSYQRLQPGDLVFFSTYEPGPSHSGIYLGDGQFISATSSRGVLVTSMDDSYWGSRYIGARRVL